jgi:ABC-type branched-subunit amino acid transport system substrate-binding protein
VQQFNDTNEIKGVKIDFKEFADDGQSAATALSEVRRLVTEDGVFAIVPDDSLNTPHDYITQQKVPTFGGGFTGAYCTPKPDKTIWLFGFQGCQVTDKPAVTGDSEALILKYVRAQTGKQHPTIAEIINDTPSGQTALRLHAAQVKGGGWGKETYNKASIPLNASDYTPYVQDLMTSGANGGPPDMIRCGANFADCLSIYKLVRAQGFKGEFEHNSYDDRVAASFNGTIVANPFQNPVDGGPAYDTLNKYVNEVKPGQKLDSGVLYGYLQTDMFIQALKTAAKSKAGITRANLQKIAATQTWEVKGLAGPTTFPASTVTPTPLCRSVVKSDGTKWVTVEPYSCTTKTYKVAAQ